MAPSSWPEFNLSKRFRDASGDESQSIGIHPLMFLDHRFCSDLFLFVQQQRLISPGTRLLLAVSGGLDSIVLLHLMQRFASKKYRSEIGVAHFDHQLRPESGADAVWLQHLCETQQIPFYLGCADVAAVRQQSEHSSLEAVARECRYRWLWQLAQAENYGAVLTAHTASDQLETVLMHLVRGTVSGVGGIRPFQWREGIQLLRPLLQHPRSQLEAYASYHQLCWREDISNQSDQFFRNRLRQQLIPYFLQENPRLETQLAEHSLLWQDEQDYLQQEALELFQQHHLLNPLRLPVAFLKKHPPALQRLLIRQALSYWQGGWKRFTSRQIEAIRGLILADTHKQLDLPGELVVVRTRSDLVFQNRFDLH